MSRKNVFFFLDWSFHTGYVYVDSNGEWNFQDGMMVFVARVVFLDKFDYSQFDCDLLL